MRILLLAIISLVFGTVFCAPLADGSLVTSSIKRSQSGMMLEQFKRSVYGSVAGKRDVLKQQAGTPHLMSRRNNAAKQGDPNGVPSPQYRRSNVGQESAPDGVPNPQI